MSEQSIIQVTLPAFYMNFTGRQKKKYAWGFLQQNHIDLYPLPQQPDLESKNVLYCVRKTDNERSKSKK